ncbi:MAG: hypothetical protein FWD73_07040 [Polyangiaceae bacterium]|nr:hypothetical protein [Polyangiaceae bacterium]
MHSRASKGRPVKAIISELEERDLLELAKKVAARHWVTVHEMLGTSRESPLPKARREFWCELYDLGWSTARIGRLVGRDHTTILVQLPPDRRGPRVHQQVAS